MNVLQGVNNGAVGDADCITGQKKWGWKGKHFGITSCFLTIFLRSGDFESLSGDQEPGGDKQGPNGDLASPVGLGWLRA